ncbi:MAG: hypothetical protein JWN61_2626 [Pseudonocardiales bacterium]|nr:hypothetical protein [Pseudonocardiales bacterium]
MAWRKPTWPLMIALIVLRALSGLGDLAGLGESAGVVIISLIFLVLSAIDIYLLRHWLKRPIAAS